MYAEIEQILKNIFGNRNSYDLDGWEIEDEFLPLVVSHDFLRDILLDYYYDKQSRDSVVQCICQHFSIDPLDLAEILGAVDELKDKQDTTDI